MCAINGIFAYHYAANDVDERELVMTRDAMRARGPDGAGAWRSDDGRVALAHRRLSIIDLSEAGAQPMCDAGKRLIITFNGEIYNYKELRSELVAQGRHFASNSDTEVLLHLYALEGASMLTKLRGMFAFAIWDVVEGTLFLARDPYGIKPLYYADDGWTFRFGSQVKALLEGGALSRDPEPAGQVGFYLFGSVPEPFTTYRQIRALPAGCSMMVDRIGHRRPVRYHGLADRWAAPATSESQAAAALHTAFRDSVSKHLVADVRVGAFLSAGVDSGALVGLMRDVSGGEIETVTLAFDEFRGASNDEAPLAAEVARLYGARHTVRVVTRAEFDAELPRIIAAMDQPTIDGINTWFVSKAARELGLKVAISGLGGDELLGGYPSFSTIPRLVRRLSWLARVPAIGGVARALIAPLVRRLRMHPKAAGLLEFGGSFEGAYLLQRGLFMPWELNSVLPRDIVDEGLRRLQPLAMIGGVLPPAGTSAAAKVAALESALYMRNQLLRDTDWASMAHGLEVRVPLVDVTLLDAVARSGVVATGHGKAILSTAPRTPLPARIAERAKTGFTTPVAAWQQSNAGLARSWSTVPALAADSCPWARRWAYGLAS